MPVAGAHASNLEVTKWGAAPLDPCREKQIPPPQEKKNTHINIKPPLSESLWFPFFPLNAQLWRGFLPAAGRAGVHGDRGEGGRREDHLQDAWIRRIEGVWF